MTPITSSSHFLSCFLVFKEKIRSLCRRIAEIATQIFKSIGSTVQSSWNQVKLLFRVDSLQDESVQTQLEPYKEMPMNGVPFLQKSIQIAKGTLKEKYGQKKADEFIENIRELRPAACLLAAEASIRAFLFSKTTYCPDFLVYWSASQHRYISAQTELLPLRERFFRLDEQTQRTILNEFSPDDVRQLNLSAAGERVMIEIIHFSVKYCQHNATQPATATVSEVLKQIKELD